MVILSSDLCRGIIRYAEHKKSVQAKNTASFEKSTLVLDCEKSMLYGIEDPTLTDVELLVRRFSFQTGVAKTVSMKTLHPDDLRVRVLLPPVYFLN